MNRTFRVVPASVWCLDQRIEKRRARLHDPVCPQMLLSTVKDEAASAARANKIRMKWQRSEECLEYFRIEAVVPLSEETFDKFFNGCSGYRAQYYLSPEEGILYNQDVIRTFADILRTELDLASLRVADELVLASGYGPHSKVWVYGEPSAFNTADRNVLNPIRWVENKAGLGRCAPLPLHRSIEFKGAFIHPSSRQLFVDELKLGRACDIHTMGYS